MTSACFILASLYVGFTYNIMIFDKMKNMPMCMCYMVQKQMETLTVATMKLIHTRISVEYLHACKMVVLYTILNMLT